MTTKILKNASNVKPKEQGKRGIAVNETPYRYFGGHNYTEGEEQAANPSKYTICVDYLAITLTGFLFHSSQEGPKALNFGDIELKRTGGGTRHYENRYQVKVKGEPFAVLLTTPRKGGALEASRPDFSEMKLENHILYREGWEKALQEVIQAIGLQFYHITRLDIALDSYSTLNIFQQHQRGELRKIGRAKYSHHYDSAGRLSGADWGSRSSNKHLTAYRVGARVEIENKAYRAHFWKANGLSDTEAVQRLELKLKAKAVRRIVQADTGEVGAHFDRLNDSAFLAGIMKAHFARWFEFRIPDPAQKNVSRWKKAEVIDWDAIEAVQMERLTTTRKPNKVWAAKRCATKLIEDNGKGYIPQAVKAYLVEHGERALKGDLWRTAEKSVESYLKANFPYLLPATVVPGIVGNMRKVVGREYAKQLNDDVLADLPRRLAYAVANQHGAGAWLHRKALNQVAV